MLRSVAVLVFLAILPGFSHSQEPDQVAGTVHEVVRGETLWDLAEVYLGNPFRWPLIHQANLDQIQNPHLIYPGQELVIPLLEEERTGIRGVAVVPEGAAEEEALPQVQEEWAPQRPKARTVFYSPSVERASPEGGSSAGHLEGSRGVQAVATLAVPPGLVYAAEWLEPFEPRVAPVGRVLLPSKDASVVGVAGRARLGQELVVETRDGSELRRGDLLLTYRPVRRTRTMGTVQMPTGILVVSEVTGGTATTLVSHLFHWVQDGDQVGFLPGDLPEPGAVPTPVSSNVAGRILGFAQDRNLYGFGARAFLDVGVGERIAVGDVFSARDQESGVETARLQVVRVNGDVSTARVVDVVSADLSTGAPVRLVATIR